MKYALIGCGRIATNHIKAVLNNHLELAAVCDVLPQQMENLLAKHELQNDSSIHRYTDYREMIEKEQPQLVGIATESGRTRTDCPVLHRPRCQRHHRKADGDEHC